MKNKKLILILIATITVIAAATVLSACDKNKGEFVDVGIELYSAKQYYVEGETFTPEGGILKVYSYNEKTKEEKYRFVDLTDKDVILENTTGARVDTYTVTARYKGLATRFKYIVQKKKTPYRVLISCCRKTTARLCIRCRVFAVKSIFRTLSV